MHESDKFEDAAVVSALRAQPPASGLEPDALPVREGLPPGFRMRADAHYVDSLDTRMSSIPVRLIDTQAIETSHHEGDAVTAAFVESVRQFGVLQPLLVTARGSRYRIISGRRRLAGAVAAGLREVPCLVQHVDDDGAERMAQASNLPATRPRAAAIPPAAPMGAALLTGNLAQALATITSCADVIAVASTVSQVSAAALVKAEAERALQMLLAVQVLRDEVPVSRSRVPAQSVLDVVDRAAAVERNLKGPFAIEVSVERAAATMSVSGDARLLASAVLALVSATLSVVESAVPIGDSRGTIFVGATASPDGCVSFVVRQTMVDVPAAWLSRAFEAGWPVRDGASMLVRLQAARKVARAHNGDIEMETAGEGSRFTLARG
jgi:ParB-like chromosome segregation protein Spo0J